MMRTMQMCAPPIKSALCSMLCAFTQTCFLSCAEGAALNSKGDGFQRHQRFLDVSDCGCDSSHTTNGLVAMQQNVQPWAEERKAALRQPFIAVQVSPAVNPNALTSGLVAVLQNVQAWSDEEKAALRQRERQIAEAEARADNLLESAAADVDKQSRGLEEDRTALAKRQQQFEQVRAWWIVTHCLKIRCNSCRIGVLPDCQAPGGPCCISTEHEWCQDFISAVCQVLLWMPILLGCLNCQAQCFETVLRACICSQC